LMFPRLKALFRIKSIISGNARDGILIHEYVNPDSSAVTLSAFNRIAGNIIGLNAKGTQSLPNGIDGIEIIGGSQNNLVGGDTPSFRNVVSGNGKNGIELSGPSVNNVATSSNTVKNNYIGKKNDGIASTGNGANGVLIIGAARGNTIGSEVAVDQQGVIINASNVIGGNSQNGIQRGKRRDHFPDYYRHCHR
jgi:hypothetical protein